MTTPTNDQLQAQINDINSKLAAAQVPGFGPSPANPDGTPGEGVTPNGVPLPWNGQAGEAARNCFQGHAEYPVPVPQGFNGMRQFVFSGVAPLFKQIEARLFDAAGNNVAFWGNSTGYMDPTANLDSAKAPYKLVIDATNPTNGAGLVQLVGGAQP